MVQKKKAKTLARNTATKAEVAKAYPEDMIHDKALGAIGRLVDNAADRDVCIRKISPAGKIPGWAVAGVGKINVAG